MWIEWEDGLINLKHVKRIYMEEDAKYSTVGNCYGGGLTCMTPFPHIKPIWRLNIVMAGEGEQENYSKTFESEKAAFDKMDSIKQICRKGFQ